MHIFKHIFKQVIVGQTPGDLESLTLQSLPF